MKPILFNTEMVKAILDGRKTVTRRLIKEIPLQAPYFEDYDGKAMASDGFGDWHPAEHFCRIQPGEILYVRETWKHYTTGTAGPGLIDGYLYKADEPQDTSGMLVEGRWRPSLHMPKDAARIFLRVTDVRAERLQDMTEDDVVAEGAEPLITGCEHMDFSVVPPEPCYNTYERCKDCIINYGYPELFGNKVWNHTIKPADIGRYGWDANPWVWVISFERCNPYGKGE